MSIVVFTGTLSQPRKEATEEAEKNGYVVGTRLTKASNFLVCGAKVGAKKMEEAQKFGVDTLTEQEWKEKLASCGSKPADEGEVEDVEEARSASPLESTTAKRKTRGEDGQNTGDDNTPPVVVFTGTLTKQSRKEATAEAEIRGFRVQPRMTKATTFLVCGDKAGQKLKEAEKLGVKVFTEQQWEEKIAAMETTEDGNAPETSCAAPPNKKRSVEADSADDASDADEVEYDEETGEVNGIKPKVLLVDGTFHDVKSASGSTYIVKRLGMAYSCSCPAWRNQRHPPNCRTCKHLKQLLGEEFETERARGSATAPRGMPGKGSSGKAIIKTTAPKVLLAKKWDRECNNPIGWWISEKLDGVRAFWDSSKKVFLSRLGNEYPAPSWFTANFPDDVDLDGELFGGRGTFQLMVGIVKTQGSQKWGTLVYKVYDVPSLKSKPFEERMAYAQGVVSTASSKYIEWVDHTQCRSLEHLDEVFNEIEKLGGEGLMIREPGSKYANGRSSSLLKIKSFHDGEAEVLAYEDGKGKYVGMVGALRCRMASGKMFKVASGLSDQQRDKPPAIGSIIVYKCQELTNDGIPRFPVFVDLREAINLLNTSQCLRYDRELTSTALEKTRYAQHFHQKCAADWWHLTPLWKADERLDDDWDEDESENPIADVWEDCHMKVTELINEWKTAVQAKLPEWKTKGLHQMEIDRRTYEMREEMIPYSGFYTSNVARRHGDVIIRHICSYWTTLDHLKINTLGYRDASQLVYALTSDIRKQCQHFSKIKQAMVGAFPSVARIRYEVDEVASSSSMNLWQEEAVTELVAGVSSCGFLCGMLFIEKSI
ncbi:hypothetical protein JM16_003698 [Phytophthora kernoviae]|uniref:DNA ligase n=1 Tax=Phytophthora kernoviae TaxID=325452 RepID=A0A8T0M3M3_9STRA|nr:hypothetical protein JM16_003698 [Phytophthora kernoviae]